MKITNNLKIGTGGIVFTDKDAQELSFTAAISKIFTRFINYYYDFELMVLHFISEHWPIFTLRKLAFSLAGMKIGRGAVVHMGVRFFQPRGISIGNDSKIGFGSFLDGRAQLVIGKHVDIASEVMIYNSEHDLNSPSFGAIHERVEVEDYVFIGPRAIIMPGVILGKGSVVAGGAVVTKSVEPFSIVGGIPAKVIGQRANKNLNYTLGRSRLFQ